MIKKNRKKIIQLIKVIISIVIIFFIFRYINSNTKALSNLSGNLNYFYLVTSFIIILIYIFNQFVLWYYITKQNKCNISFSNSIIARAYSEFGKYVPGKIFGYGLLLYAYSKENQSKVLVAFCMVFELLSSMLAAALILLFSLYYSGIQEFEKYRIAALILLAFFFVLIHPKILNYFLSFILKIAKREPIQINMTYIQLIKIIFLYVANFMVFGVAVVLFINSVYPVSFSYYFYITGTTTAAGLIGLFAIFVPAGLGVREGILLFTLSLIIPPSFAGIIALLSRIWLIAGEIILFGLIYTFSYVIDVKIKKGKLQSKIFF
jgi:glycosyltransferase 2 family protein